MNRLHIHKLLALPQAGLKKKEQFIFTAYVFFLASAVFSWRAVSSISIALILLVSLFTRKKHLDATVLKHGGKNLLIFSFLYFSLLCISLTYTSDLSQGWKHIQMSSGIVFIPMAVMLTGTDYLKKVYHHLFSVFLILLCIAALYCLAMAFYAFIQPGSVNNFFYHELVGPVKGHAIRFSIFIFAGLLFAWDQLTRKVTNHPVYFKLAICFLSFFLLLLSSKLVIVFYVISVLIILIKRKILSKTKALFLILAMAGAFSAILLIKNPIRERYALMLEGDRQLFRRDQFDQGIYFNGVQFRLLQWRLVPFILDKEKSWLEGVSPGDARQKLNEQYQLRKMYTGNPGTEDRGLLDYHTHNQFLQTLLTNGLTGLLAWMMLLITMGYYTWKKKELTSTLWFIFLIIYCFTDAILETQYGIVIFSFFSLFSYLSHRFKGNNSRATQ